MKRLTVNDLPIVGKFTVIEVVTRKILHSYDDEGKGDFPLDIANRDVIAFYASEDITIIEVV